MGRYAALLPDEPRWVDTRGILLCWPATVIESPAGPDPAVGGGFVVASRAEPVGAVVGRPGREAILEGAQILTTAADEASADVLCQPDDAAAVAEALPGWSSEGATLHRLAGDRPHPLPLRADAEIALVSPEERDRVAAEDVPGHVYQELDLTWRRGRPVAVAFVPGPSGGAPRPAAFLSAALETEGWWDVSVETLPEHRRGGLAAACFHALHAHYRELGKRAVWGAHDSNPASLRLAHRLGFVPDSRLRIFKRP